MNIEPKTTSARLELGLSPSPRQNHHQNTFGKIICLALVSLALTGIVAIVGKMVFQ